MMGGWMGGSPADQRGRSLTEEFRRTAGSKYVQFQVPVEMSKVQKAAFLSIKGFQSFGGRFRGEHIEIYGIFSTEHFLENMENLKKHFTDATEITKEDFLRHLESDPAM